MIPARPETPAYVHEPTTRDIMHYARCTLGRAESLARAHEKMRRFQASQLAVVEDGRVVGIVTTRALHRVRASSRGVTVADVMSSAVIAVDPLMLARDVATVADERAATHVAVVHRGVVIGTFAVEETRLGELPPGRPTAGRRSRRSATW